MYLKIYNSPIGEIYINSDGEYITSLCFKDTKDYNRYTIQGEDKNLPIFEETFKWLDIYFNDQSPNFIPNIEEMI